MFSIRCIFQIVKLSIPILTICPIFGVRYNLKTLVHLAALKAIQLKGKFKDYYQRKVGEGKNKMAVLNAVRNKIIHTVFALVKHEQKYDESYIY